MAIYPSIKYNNYQNSKAVEVKMEQNNLEFECNNLTNGSRFPLDHPVKGFTHWVIWNIPAINTIPEGIPHGRKIPSLGGISSIIK